MAVGIFARTFGRSSVEEVFAAVAAQGLRCVQFNFACAGLPSLPDAMDPATLERIRRAAEQHSLSLAAVSGTFNLIHPDPAQRQAGLRRLEVVAGAARALGSPVVTLCTGTRDPADMWRRHPDNDTPEAWQDLVRSLSVALATAEKHEITLGVEPERANVIDSAQKARRLLDELRSPRLKIILDGANLFERETVVRMRELLDEAFERLGRDLVLAHAKELSADGRAGNLPIGAGVLDWDRYLRWLRRDCRAVPLIVHGVEEKDVATSLAFLRQHIAAAERET